MDFSSGWADSFRGHGGHVLCAFDGGLWWGDATGCRPVQSLSLLDGQRNCWMVMEREQALMSRWWLTPGCRFFRKRILKFTSSSRSGLLCAPK